SRQARRADACSGETRCARAGSGKARCSCSGKTWCSCAREGPGASVASLIHMRNLCLVLASLACGTALAQRGGIPPAMSPPPAPAVVSPPTSQGVPPTPAPAFPGLPTTPTVPSTPSTTGPARINSSFSRGAEVNDPTQVAAAQVDLAGLGFFVGPV